MGTFSQVTHSGIIQLKCKMDTMTAFSHSYLTVSFLTVFLFYLIKL